MILQSPRLAVTLEALARAYDHLVIDAGAMTEGAVVSFARIAPRAVLVSTDPSAAATDSTRSQLIAAGFVDVWTVQGRPGAVSAEPAAA
jgi:MinD-like ATPase involved in chromosome partitioning or flagellar assembly